jgi:hypothetical protein
MSSLREERELVPATHETPSPYHAAIQRAGTGAANVFANTDLGTCRLVEGGASE